MGCASSKQHRRCRHCQKRPYSPVRRSHSMKVPAQHKNDNFHVVALKSSTVGSLKLDFSSQANHLGDGYDVLAVNGDNRDKIGDKFNGNRKLDESEEETKTEFPAGVMEAKIWSKMIEEKIPKVMPRTPTRTPPGEPETINTWELMEGLEDVISPFRSPREHRSLSFSGTTTSLDDQLPEPKVQSNSPRPMWLQMEEGDRVPSFIVPEFDPDVISTFRESFQKQEQRGGTKLNHDAEPKPDFSVPELISALRKSLDEEEMENSFGAEQEWKSFDFYPKKKGEKERVVLYFTSLRGVRKTYEDCCHIRVILKGMGVRVDERDVSMHSGFRDELRELIGDKSKVAGVLPAVFIGRKFIGGAEEIRQMHEEGQLEKLVEGCETAEQGGGVGGGACEACGDIRFVPCETCNGSCKVYYEEEVEEAEEAEEMGEFGFHRCPDCNENGLIRCPVCCD